jgi:hypothetical protein
MTAYRLYVFKMILNFVCCVMAIIEMFDVCKYAKQENLLKTTYHGIWCITMVICASL